MERRAHYAHLSFSMNFISRVRLFISCCCVCVWFHCFIDFSVLRSFYLYNIKECFNDTLFILILQLDTQKTLNWREKKIDWNLNKGKNGWLPWDSCLLTLMHCCYCFLCDGPTNKSSNYNFLTRGKCLTKREKTGLGLRIAKLKPILKWIEK